MKYTYTITEETQDGTECRHWVRFAYSDRARAIYQLNAIEAQEKVFNNTWRYAEYNKNGERRIVLKAGSNQNIKYYYLQKVKTN